MQKILLIDDDVKYQALLKELLILDGYKVKTANDPVKGLELFKGEVFDLVITDLIMDTIDGLQLVTVMKKINPFIPIIVLTGHEDYTREIEGLDLDVSDYIYKPVPFPVLLKRIKNEITKVRSTKKLDSLTSEADKILVDCKERKVYQDNKEVELTVKEYDLLCYFLANKNKTLSRQEILESVWRIQDDIVDERTIDTHVRKLRAKIKISSIISVRGIGYEWFE